MHVSPSNQQLPCDFNHGFQRWVGQWRPERRALSPGVFGWDNIIKKKVEIGLLKLGRSLFFPARELTVQIRFTEPSCISDTSVFSFVHGRLFFHAHRSHYESSLWYRETSYLPNRCFSGCLPSSCSIHSIRLADIPPAIVCATFSGRTALKFCRFLLTYVTPWAPKTRFSLASQPMHSITE